MYQDLTVYRVTHRYVSYYDVHLTNAYMESMRRSLVRVNEPERTAYLFSYKGIAVINGRFFKVSTSASSKDPNYIISREDLERREWITETNWTYWQKEVKSFFCRWWHAKYGYKTESNASVRRISIN